VLPWRPLFVARHILSASCSSVPRHISPDRMPDVVRLIATGLLCGLSRFSRAWTIARHRPVAPTKSQAQRLAVVADDGFAHAIRPVHTSYDGATCSQCRPVRPSRMP